MRRPMSRITPRRSPSSLPPCANSPQSLRDDGWTVAYTRLDDPDNSGSITGELIRRAAEHDAAGVVYTEPGEWRLINALDDCR